jgi:hypothetical protein
MTTFKHRRMKATIEAQPGTFRHVLLSGHSDWRTVAETREKPSSTSTVETASTDETSTAADA